MIKLNETTLNELLFELRNNFNFDYEDDLVSIQVYVNRETHVNMIGSFVSTNSIGEWLLEAKIKGFRYDKTSRIHNIVAIIEK